LESFVLLFGLSAAFTYVVYPPQIVSTCYMAETLVLCGLGDTLPVYLERFSSGERFLGTISGMIPTNF
jgi:hypothetical protein